MMKFGSDMKEQYRIILSKYIPERAVTPIVNWVIELGIHIKITSERSTKLGDFRPTLHASKGHKITINYNLNQYAFLITLVHEIAHLITWNRFKQSVKPHGTEWKQNFRELMLPFLQEDVFPSEIAPILLDYLNNPAASSCTAMNLMRILMKYDDSPRTLLEDLPENAVFALAKGRLFKKGAQRRKYFSCIELSSGRQYLINPLAEVELQA